MSHPVGAGAVNDCPSELVTVFIKNRSQLSEDQLPGLRCYAARRGE